MQDVFVYNLKYNKINISMDWKVRAIDIIFIERLWRSVKYEDVSLNMYEYGLTLWKGLGKYLKFYNNEDCINHWII